MQDEIIRLYNLGVQIKNIATLTNEPYGRVLRIIYQDNNLCQRRKSFSRSEVGKIRDLYLTGRLTKKQISERLQINVHRVTSILRAYNIKKRIKTDLK